MYIEFFNDQKNLDMISCYSNEGDGWDKTKIKLENTKLNIFFREKFKDRRGTRGRSDVLRGRANAIDPSR